MKAIIMAGGEGSRLRPLTCDCPKPMMRLLDRPVMEYALKLLKKHGVREAAVTLGYLPDAIVDFFGDGGDWGLSLRYYTERAPLGTAGGVRQAADFLDETFCVLSGDGVTDLDLSAALAFHREHGALATMVLTRVPDPMEYGLVIPAADGRVRAFVEKPGPGEAISDTVNTGIYILEPEIFAHIPEGKPCDFGGELFPRLVGEGRAVYGCVLEGYWCDIGDVSAYLRAHTDLLDGKLTLDVPTGVQKGALVDEDARIEQPCYIGAGARVERGALVGKYAVVGAGAAVEARGSVKRSVLWPGARVGREAQARGCVLAGHALLGAQAMAFEGCALGTGAQAMARAQLLPGVKLWPYKVACEGERLESNRVWGAGAERGFSGDSLPLADPAQATRAAQALRRLPAARRVSAGADALGGVAGAVPRLRRGADVPGRAGGGRGRMHRAPAALCAARAGRGRGGAGGQRFTCFPLTGCGRARGAQEAPRASTPCCCGRTSPGRLPASPGRCSAPGARNWAMWRRSPAPFDADPEGRRRRWRCSPRTRTCSTWRKKPSGAPGCAPAANGRKRLMELEGDEVGVWLDAGRRSMPPFPARTGRFLRPRTSSCSSGRRWRTASVSLLLPAGFTRAAETLCARYEGAQARFAAVERGRWLDALARERPGQFLLLQRRTALRPARACGACPRRADAEPVAGTDAARTPRSAARWR